MRAFLAGPTLALACTGVCTADDAVLYARADVTVAVMGEASLSRAYTRRIELPWPDCEDGEFTCVEDALYAQVYEIAFVEETVSRAPDGTPEVDRIDRGRLLVAVEFPPDVEREFEGALAEHLRVLAAASYASPQAGMEFLDGPLEQTTLEESVLPAWVCRELDGAFTFDAVVPREKRRTFAEGDEVAHAACAAIAGAAAGTLPDVYRTMPDIRGQIRREVRFDEAQTTGGLTWADRLARIPESATLEKIQLEKNQPTGGLRNRRDGVFIGKEGRFGDTQRDVRLLPAALDVVAAPMWVGKWTFRTIREAFGDAPRIAEDPVESILVAVLPIADPLMDELDRPRTPLTVPSRRLVERAIAGFEREATLGPQIVLDAFSDPGVWPSKGDWMIVSCTDDGAARYGISPFASVVRVTNPEETCAAVQRELGD